MRQNNPPNPNEPIEKIAAQIKEIVGQLPLKACMVSKNKLGQALGICNVILNPLVNINYNATLQSLRSVLQEAAQSLESEGQAQEAALVKTLFMDAFRTQDSAN